MTNNQHGVAARIASRNKSAPDSSPSHGTPVEQPPRSLLTSSLRSDSHCGNGSDEHAADRGYSLAGVTRITDHQNIQTLS
jgi:hypothetical protein